MRVPAGWSTLHTAREHELLADRRETDAVGAVDLAGDVVALDPLKHGAGAPPTKAAEVGGRQSIGKSVSFSDAVGLFWYSHYRLCFPL